MLKLVFQILIDGEESDVFYIADSKEDAIRKHIKRCAKVYFENFNKKADMSFFDGIDAKEFIVIHE